MLEVGKDGEVETGKARLTPNLVGRLVNKGATLTSDPLEVRGLRWEIEFRLHGTIVGRIRKEDFLLAISCVSPG
jgi:hypothetical protein